MPVNTRHKSLQCFIGVGAVFKPSISRVAGSHHVLGVKHLLCQLWHSHGSVHKRLDRISRQFYILQFCCALKNSPLRSATMQDKIQDPIICIFRTRICICISNLPVLSATTRHKRGKTRHEEVETGEGNLWDEMQIRIRIQMQIQTQIQIQIKCMLRNGGVGGQPVFFSVINIINIKRN